MKNISKLIEKSKQLHQAGKIDEAIEKYKVLIKTIKNNSQIYYLLGTAFLQTKNYKQALLYLTKAIEIKDDVETYYNNIGIALSQLNNNEEAIVNYIKALNINPNFIDANINLGIAYKKVINFKESIKYFNNALKLSPNNYKIYNNIGNLLRDMGKVDEAIKSYDKSIKLKNDNAEAYNNKAEIFLSKKKFVDAIEMFGNALKIDPKFPYLFGKLFHTKMHICDWEDFKDNLKKIERDIKNNEKIIEPFPMLSLIDNMNLQKRNSVLYNNIAFQKQERDTKIITNVRSKKIKLGYFGAEFYNHPVLQLTRDIYKNHDKTKFEVYGFFHGPVKDKLHFEVQKYFDNFYDVTNQSDEEIISLSRKIGIQIAINLTGYTSDSRNEIYLKRVAPIQISFLGYSGTMGTDFIDYIIGDKVLIPDKYKKYYTEKVLTMPGTFFPNPANIVISDKNFDKKSLGIPNDSFVFGSFNNSYKITPDIFEIWMRILKKSKKSVLWLLDNNKIASNNLKKECKKCDVDPDRIIFAEKLIYKEHLKRFEIMDLFLDTFPYNGHTTVIEAIRRKVPTLTLMGESFASRVAGSILNAIGLEELISTDIEDYLNKAIELSQNHKKFREIKKKIENKNALVLFDSKKYTQDLEKLYFNTIEKNL